jgi:LPXTG cell wall anchor motif
MSFKLLTALFGAGLATGCYLVTPAFADEWNKKTTLQFNQPVEVPGRVLTAGKYVFQLADSSSNRDIVQIFSEDKQGMDHLVTTAMAVPAYQLNTPEKTEVTFEERHLDTPEAVHTWFYPGDNYGWEFVYPKSQQLLAANATPAVAQPVKPGPTPNQPLVVAATPQPALTSTSSQPAATTPPPKPAEQPVTIAQNRPPAAKSPQPPGTPNRLPKTASNLPFTTGLGGLMTAMGVVVLASRRRLFGR